MSHGKWSALQRPRPVTTRQTEVRCAGVIQDGPFRLLGEVRAEMRSNPANRATQALPGTSASTARLVYGRLPTVGADDLPRRAAPTLFVSLPSDAGRHAVQWSECAWWRRVLNRAPGAPASAAAIAQPTAGLADGLRPRAPPTVPHAIHACSARERPSRAINSSRSYDSRTYDRDGTLLSG